MMRKNQHKNQQPSNSAIADVTVCRIRFPELVEGFETARLDWAGCGCAACSAILVYAQTRQTRRRLKITDAFFEPNSSTLPGDKQRDNNKESRP